MTPKRSEYVKNRDSVDIVLRDARNKLEELENKITDLERQRNDLQSRLDQFDANNTWLEKNREDIESQLYKFQTKNTTLEHELGNLKTKNTTLEHELGNLKTKNTTLEHELGNLKTKNTTLEHELGNLKTKNTTLEHELGNLKTKNTTLAKKLTDANVMLEKSEANNRMLKQSWDDLKSTLEKANELLEKSEDNNKILKQSWNDLQLKLEQTRDEAIKYQNELHGIKSSLGYKVTRFYGSKIDKLFGRKSIIHDIKRDIIVSREVIKNEGFDSFLNHAGEKIKKREFTIVGPTLYDLTTKKTEPKTTVTASSHLFSTGNKQISNYVPKFKTYIIVRPQNNFDQRITTRIKSQMGLDLDVIMINNNDVRKSRQPQSNREYVILVNGNSLPLTDHLFYDMCKIMYENSKIAIVMCKEIPGSDSDLAHSYFINKSYTSLESRDKIVFDKNFKKLSNTEKTHLIKMNDSCMCYRSNILAKYDLDKGKLDHKAILDILDDGYVIEKSFSLSTAQYQPTNSDYYLQHGFEYSINSICFIQDYVDFGKIGISELDELSNHISVIYSSLCNTIDSLEKSTITNIVQAFSLLYKSLSSAQSSNVNTSYSKPIVELLEKLPNIKKKIDTESYVLNKYVDSLKNFEHYVNEIFPNLKGIEKDFVKALCNVFEETIGEILGEYVIYAKKNNIQNDNLVILEQISKVGIS